MSRAQLIAWLPLAVLPAAVVLLTPNGWPGWAFMWLFAFAVYTGCKWLTWRTARPGASAARSLGYLTAWPGMDADAFLRDPSSDIPRLSSWFFAGAKLGFGIVLIAGSGTCLHCAPGNPLLRRWVAMVGIVFVLHFGLFLLLSLLWQTAGVSAKPIMDWPVLARSVSEFWGQRWNRAFRDLTHRFVFRPLAARWGPKTALAVGFLLSGMVHDLVISLPARGGWGGPTVFFLVQAAAIFVERSTLGRRIGLMHGMRGWAFTMAVLVVPLPLLFHAPFVCNVVAPFVDWLTGGLR
jgi:alginate O-acetyltransferase complex protein AlgI